jgi:hypothetical protein
MNPPNITIFTAPKPFTNPHIATIQSNALRNWKALGAEVEIIVLGEEDGLAQAATGIGVRHLPNVARNSSGTPLVNDLFRLARENSSSHLLAYVNADILLLPNFVESARKASLQVEKFLIVGQRWDLDVQAPLEFSANWSNILRQQTQAQGKLHPPMGSDYFIFPRTCFQEIPTFAIGRAGWDNWMIYEARCRGWLTLDATADIFIIHQNHDYSHLPNSQPHYRLPETFENVRLAGGKRTVFHLEDVKRRLVNGQIKSLPFSEAEILPLVKLHSQALAHITFAIFHPRKAYMEFRTWLRSKKGK